MDAEPREDPRRSCAHRHFISTHGYLVLHCPGGSWLHVRQGSPVTNCDSGGPAIVELALVRPETLRPHLSVGLPLSESRGVHHNINASQHPCDTGHNSSSKKDVRKRRH